MRSTATPPTKSAPPQNWAPQLFFGLGPTSLAGVSFPVASTTWHTFALEAGWKSGAAKFNTAAPAYAIIGGSYIGSMWNQPATYPSGEGVLIPSTTFLRYLQPGYGTLDAAIGVSKDNWYAELYGTNLLNSHASTFTSSSQFIESQVPLRPAVVMMKFGVHY